MGASIPRTRFVWPALVFLAASGCAYASKITAPGGGEAFCIRCAEHAQCIDKAGEVCSNAYEVLSTKTVMDGYANNGTGYAMTPDEMVVVCRSSAAPRASAPAMPAAPVAEASPCVAAQASVPETSAFWAQLYTEAKRLEEAPSPRDFGEVCRALPERVQRCLDARYREAHAKPCLAVLRRLEPAEKNRIDSLFLE